MSLGLQAQRILAFENKWTKHSGRKSDHIIRELGLTRARYFQMLNAILDDPAALAHDPVTVHRLRKVREERAANRASRLFG